MGFGEFIRIAWTQDAVVSRNRIVNRFENYCAVLDNVPVDGKSCGTVQAICSVGRISSQTNVAPDHLIGRETLTLRWNQRTVINEWHLFVIFKQQLLQVSELYAERVVPSIFMRTNATQTRRKQIAKQSFVKLCCVAIAAFASACAVIQPPDAGGPRNMGPLYPVLLTEQAQRFEASNLAFSRLTQNSGPQSGVQLQPITAAIQSLPTTQTAPLYLPKVGIEPEMNEEETRESLRRFITDWRSLIGADPAHLSLVERTDRPDGLKLAKYEQRPFRYPLRGGYGTVEIQFLANRMLRNMTSTCLPDAERLQAALAQVTPKLTAADAIKLVQTSDVVYTNVSGQQVTTRIGANDQVSASELVTYVFPTTGRTDALELHIAWEINVGDNPHRLIYVDAVEGTILRAVIPG